MRGKRYKNIVSRRKADKAYPLEEALKFVVENPAAGFDESVDTVLALGIDPRKNDQQVRGQVVLPGGLGRKVRVLVFAKGASEEEAQKAGADFTGAEDMVQKIKQEGWLGFDRVIATPDMMPVVSKVAKILGPRGLMPNPKSGTVTTKISLAVQAEKKGTASIRADKHGLVLSSIGRRSMGTKGLKQNFLAFLSEVIKLKPPTSKGVFLKKIALSSTMGPSVPLSVSECQSHLSS